MPAPTFAPFLRPAQAVALRVSAQAAAIVGAS